MFMSVYIVLTASGIGFHSLHYKMNKCLFLSFFMFESFYYCNFPKRGYFVPERICFNPFEVVFSTEMSACIIH